MKIIETPANKIFFTSDIHFGQEGLHRFNNRPFKDDEDMVSSMTKEWNNMISEDGLVFVLGDIGETSDKRILDIFSRLNGTKILIRGNHDVIYKDETLQEMFTEIYDLLDVKIYDAEDDQYQEIVLCHFPMFDWNNFFEGSWQLFGHLHTRNLPEFGTLKTKLFPQQYDVGVDANNFRPISYYEIKRIIKEQVKAGSFKESNYY